MCLARLVPSEHGCVAPSTNDRGVPPAVRIWRKRLSSSEWQVADGVQSLTVEELATPDVMPMYWLRLFWAPSVSAQSVKYEHWVASPCRNGIVVGLKPIPTAGERPPVQVRFSSTSTTTWS